MIIKGETLDDVKLQISDNPLIEWNLGKCVIIQHLGVDVLIGEPAKVDNRITTIPHRRVIMTYGTDGKKVTLPFLNYQDSQRHLVKVNVQPCLFILLSLPN